MATQRLKRAGIVLATAGIAAASLYGLGPNGALASSHREAPLIAADPTVDNTDVYAFVSPDKANTVTLIANWIPFEEPNGGPNFYPFATDARYNFFVDNDGDAKPDVTMRFTFKTQDRRGGSTFLYNNGPVTSLDDPNLLFRQTYTLETSVDDGKNWIPKIRNAPVAPSRVGAASMPNYQTLRDQAITSANGWKTFAGQADDPFFLDLRVFDLLYGGDLSEVGQDTVKGYNVNTIAVQVPFSDVALKGDAKRNPVIGVWSTTERERPRVKVGNIEAGTEWVQVSRLGNPLVNEVVVPANLKDAFNASQPRKDLDNAAIVNRVKVPEVPALIEAIYGLKAPATPRDDLVEIFLTGITTKDTGPIKAGPIKADLNSQVLNKDVDASKFRPSEMLRLNLGVPVSANPNRLGVLASPADLQGFPNGRRLTDDVLDIELQALEGAALTGIVDALKAGDKVDANDNAFGASFPYVALPNGIAVNTQTSNGPSTMNNVIMSASGAAAAGSVAFLAMWWSRRRNNRRTATAAAAPTEPIA
jgi:hypothetical protein